MKKGRKQNDFKRTIYLSDLPKILYNKLEGKNDIKITYNKKCISSTVDQIQRSLSWCAILDVYERTKGTNKTN